MWAQMWIYALHCVFLHFCPCVYERDLCVCLSPQQMFCLGLKCIWKHIYVCHHMWVFGMSMSMHACDACACVCVLASMCLRLCVEYDLRILRLIVAVFHIIDSERRYRQAKRRQLAAAPASGMGLWYDILCVSAQAINNSDTFLYAWESPWFSLP